jgi:hypothetical protein
VPPDRVLVLPNMSDNPIPLPECIRIVTIRNRDDRIRKKMTTEVDDVHQRLPDQEGSSEMIGRSRG